MSENGIHLREMLSYSKQNTCREKVTANFSPLMAGLFVLPGRTVNCVDLTLFITHDHNSL